jgi:hypothetical protein
MVLNKRDRHAALAAAAAAAALAAAAAAAAAEADGEVQPSLVAPPALDSPAWLLAHPRVRPSQPPRPGQAATGSSTYDRL